MKIKLIFILIILSFCIVEAYVSFNWSLENAKSDPEKSDHIIFIRVLERKIVGEEIDSTSLKIKKIIRPQMVRLRVSKVLKGNLKKDDIFNFSIGSDFYPLNNKIFDPKDCVEDISPFEGLRQQNTQAGFDFKVGHSYLIFLDETEQDEFGQMYFLRSGPYSIGWVKYIDGSELPYISFNSIGDKWQKPIKLQKYLDGLKKKLVE